MTIASYRNRDAETLGPGYPELRKETHTMTQTHMALAQTRMFARVTWQQRANKLQG